MINKVLFWNIRSVRTQKSFERLIDLHRRNHYSYIALLEPFQNPAELERYRIKLGMPKAKASSSAKIWIFWKDDWEEQDYNDTGQQLTVNFQKRGTTDIFSVTAVYARCNALERLELWESLEDIAFKMQKPWLVGGDFNTIRSESEKLGGLPVTQLETIDFNLCISSCALNELNFKGSSFTWWNGRVGAECIFERLDRVFGNEEFMNLLPNNEVQHLIRQGSDHAPLQGEITGNPFTVVHSKMKKVKLEIAKWSKKTFGNVF
ncbi:uncharacterized protein LOC125877592 [Solanum stenotomum]|uniref:uncharacterized protein LOC125877592 n=1 Tax=Solanum stenotomum TaxID=172797 RepID=UPI0020D0C637|nr:uncharacterized protein LOC125877592 [Solanum stenotomum]